MKTTQPNPTSDHFAGRVDELRQALRAAGPQQLAARTGTTYTALEEGKGVFRLALFERAVDLLYPSLIARDPDSQKAMPLPVQALLMYYFNTADGVPLAGRWASFAELPGGCFYNQAFQGYSGKKLAQAFAGRESAWSEAARQLGGERAGLGEASFVFQALPRLPLLVAFWQGDEDFPSSFQVLFDAAATHYLPIDVCAILGGMLAGKLIAAAPQA